jgi:hypothetical protein
MDIKRDLALLVESGADKTVVGLMEIGDRLPKWKDRFSTPKETKPYLDSLVKSARKVLADSYRWFDEGVNVEVLELSSAGDIDQERGLVTTTNSGELVYGMQEACDALKNGGIDVRLWGVHNDMPPGVKGALMHILDDDKVNLSSSESVTVIHSSSGKRWSDNLAYIMPGGGDGVCLAIKDKNGKYVIPEGEGGHLLIGDRGDNAERSLVTHLMRLRGQAPAEYEHAIGGMFLGGVYDWVRSTRPNRQGIKELDEKITDLGKAAPIISKAADEGNLAAQDVMDMGTELLVRSGLEYATAIKAGVVAYAGHFFNNSKFARERFEYHLDKEVAGRVHEKAYRGKIDFILLSDSMINERGLAAFANERFREDEETKGI